MWILHSVQNDRSYVIYKMNKSYYVYIMASKRNGTLYTGVTRDLERRVNEHKNNIINGFTSKYNIHNLVYYEETNDINEALEYEKRIKGWLRKKKIVLIETNNPKWEDLAQNWNT